MIKEIKRFFVELEDYELKYEEQKKLTEFWQEKYENIKSRLEEIVNEET
jgi:hypothetical protein